MTLFQSTAINAANVEETSPLSGVLKSRANIFEMTHTAEHAVLRPKDPGGLSHNLRASLAARIATMEGCEELSAHYLEHATAIGVVSDPAQSGGAEHGLIVAFADKAASATKDIVRADVERLQAAGVSDADIVRLCELVAFLGYQLRVFVGLRLLQDNAS